MKPDPKKRKRSKSATGGNAQQPKPTNPQASPGAPRPQAAGTGTPAEPAGMQPKPAAAAPVRAAGAREVRTEKPEPTVGSSPVPVWLVVAFGALFYWGQLYLDRNAGGFNPAVYEPFSSFAQVEALRPKSGAEQLLARGEILYTQTCAPCHQPSGLGLPGQFPPLAGSEWVNAPEGNHIIRIALHGLSGPIEVKGQPFRGDMPAMGAAFNDEDLAAVASYVRHAWGNNSPPVTPEQVKAIREQTADRVQPWSAQELSNLGG